MKTKPDCRALAVLACAWLSAQAALGQSFEEARQFAARAEALYSEGDPAKARDVLMAGARRCADEHEAPCRLLMYYSLGYLEQRLGARDAELRSMHLERAEGYYRRVLGMEPGHGPTLNNLALVYAGLGARAEAISLLERAAAADSGRAADYLVLLGDLQMENDDLDAAIGSYGRAAAARPGWSTPLRRTVDVYGVLPVLRVPELFERCTGWQATAPDIAKLGYELIVRRVHGVRSDLAERALLAWTELAANRNQLGARVLTALPAEWTDPPIAELRAFVNDPDHPTSWWVESDRRRQVLANAASTLGRNAALRGEIAAATDFWRAGYDRAPRVESYLYGSLVGERIVRLDLATDLASLAMRHPEAAEVLDMARLERELYRGKADVYAANNLEAIQRYHTVLGRIYSDRNVWTSEVRYRNGIFQLSNALRTAAIREGQTGYYQPLPDLKRRLAEGYLELGRITEARERYIDAAQAYLDTDELGDAAEMLAAAQRLRPDSREVRKMDQLQKILVERQAQALREVAADAHRAARLRADWQKVFAVTAAMPSRYTIEASPYLYPGASNVLDDAFLARQRFKLMADEAGAANPIAASEALVTAMDNGVTLIGASDLNRLEQAQDVVLSSLGPNEIKSTHRVLAAATSAGGSNLRIALPGSSSPSIAVIDTDSRVAARIAATPSFDWSAERPQITFYGGNVVIKATEEPVRAEWIDEISKFPDVAVILRESPQ